eukprot:gene28381-35173_t
MEGTVRAGDLDRCCTARQLAALREHQVLLTGSGPMLADLINTQHRVISKLANAVRKPFPGALEGRHRTTVDKDTGDVSMKVYAVKDQEEISLSLTTLLPLLPFVEEGFYVALGGTCACSLREATAKVPARLQGRMRTFMLIMLYPYICEALADKPNDAQFWDNPRNRALKSQFILPQEVHNALGFQKDEADHEDAFKCHDIGVRTTLIENPGERIMVLDSRG